MITRQDIDKFIDFLRAQEYEICLQVGEYRNRAIYNRIEEEDLNWNISVFLSKDEN